MQDIKYKDNLIEKIGGQSQYDFVVIDYCENIKDDPSLEHFFGQFQLRDLIKLQKHFLDAVFLDVPPEEAAALKGELIHKYYRLLHMGMNEYYFERLEGHFLEALRESWAEDALVEQFKKCFEELRPLFERSGKAPIQEHHHGLELVFDKEFGPHSASAMLVNSGGEYPQYCNVIFTTNVERNAITTQNEIGIVTENEMGNATENQTGLTQVLTDSRIRKRPKEGHRVPMMDRKFKMTQEVQSRKSEFNHKTAETAVDTKASVTGIASASTLSSNPS